MCSKKGEMICFVALTKMLTVILIELFAIVREYAVSLGDKEIRKEFLALEMLSISLRQKHKVK